MGKNDTTHNTIINSNIINNTDGGHYQHGGRNRNCGVWRCYSMYSAYSIIGTISRKKK